MQLFWAKGYEATQLADLTAALSIAPPSFYAAFGSKEAIFREALALYAATEGARSMAVLDEAPRARAAMRAMLMASVDTALAGPSAGCMVSLGLINASDRSQALQEDLRGLRQQTLDMVRARLERAAREWDMRPGADPARLAEFFVTVMHGLSLRARDGAGRDELTGIVDTAMLVFDA